MTWLLVCAGMKNIVTQKGKVWLLPWLKVIEAQDKGTSKHGQDIKYMSTSACSETAPELGVKPKLNAFLGFCFTLHLFLRHDLIFLSNKQYFMLLQANVTRRVHFIHKIKKINLSSVFT